MQISILFILDPFSLLFIDSSLSFLWFQICSIVFRVIIQDRLESMKGKEKGSRIKRNEICIFAKILFYFHSFHFLFSVLTILSSKIRFCLCILLETRSKNRTQSIYFTENSSVKSRYIQMRSVERLCAILERMTIFFQRIHIRTKIYNR